MDSEDYSRIHILLKRKTDAAAYLSILTVEFGKAFPAEPPQMSVRAFTDGGARSLDPRLYRYSPRWDAERMAAELHDHAWGQLTAVFAIQE